MIARKSGSGNGQDVPAWFRAFLKEYRADREANERRWQENERRWEESERRWEGNERRWEGNERRWRANDEEFSDMGHAIKTLAESVQHLTVEVRDSITVLHRAQLETNARLEALERAQSKTTRELQRTRDQSARMFRTLICEVRRLRE